MTTLQDTRGLAMTGADAAAAEAFETALGEFQCYVGNPVASVDKALEASASFPMANVLKAYLFLSGTEGPGVPVARECLAAARKGRPNDRERQHLAAIEALIEGRWEDCVARLEALLLDYPRDILALQIAHLFDFYRGDARNLRDRVVRRLHAWSPSDQNWHALLSMQAFGNEEMGDYARAQALGEESVALQPRDGWGWHAVAHVHEMRNDPAAGIAWLEPNSRHWGPDSLFDVHNWWHLALYKLELDRVEEVLKLYDEQIRVERSSVVLDMVDASAMLWRLKLRGHEPGQVRWSEIAAAWEGLIQDGNYCFNDAHALMAFIGAGRQDLVERQLATLKRSAGQPGSNQTMAQQVGIPVGEALVAFDRGDFAGAAERLQRVRAFSGRMGGSHAQRDILDLTLIEAAKRGGDANLLAALATERVSNRPNSPLARRYRDAAATLPRVA